MSLRNQSALVFAASLVQLVFGMAAGILSAQLLGPEGKGIAVTAFLVPAFVCSLGSLSLGEASTYYLGQGVAAGRVVGSTILEALGLGLCYALIAGLLLLGPLRQVVHAVPAPLVLLGLATIPLMLLKNFGDSLLTGQKRVNAFVIGNLSNHVLRGTLLFLFLFVWKLGVLGAVLAELLTWLFLGGFYLRSMIRDVPVEWRIDRSYLRDQFRYGSQTHVGNIAQRLNLQLDMMLLSTFAGATAVGLYSVAVTLAQVLWYIPDSIGRLLFPRVASSSRAEANRVTPLACRNTVLLTLVGAGVVVAVGPLLIPIVYGPGFAASVRPLLILLPGIVALSVSKILSKYLSGIGRPFSNSISSLVALAVNAPLLYLLIPALGVEGAALASAVAYGVHALVCLVFFLRESRVSPLATLIPTPADWPLYRQGLEQLWRKIRRPGGR